MFARAKAVLPCIALGLAVAQSGLAQRSTGIVITDYNSLNDAVRAGGRSIFDSNATVNLAGAAEVLVVETVVVLDGRTNVNGSTNSATISRASGTGPMFSIKSNGSLTLLNLTLSGGLSSNGGAIFNDTGGTLIISNCVLTGNTATNYAGADGVNATSQGSINGGNGGDGLNAAGGAIVSHGTLKVYYSIFKNNTVTAGNGGKGGSGIRSFVFGGNGGNGGNGGSAEGGAIVCTGGTNIFIGTDFTDNKCTAGSGGAAGSPATGAFAGNPGSGGIGGGSVGGAVVASGSLFMSNCLFTGNSTAGGGTSSFSHAGGAATGGGLDLSSSKNAAVIVNTTFYQNSCQGGAGGGNSSRNLKPAGNGGSAIGGGLASSAALTILTNCTLATNNLTGGTAGVTTTSQSNGLPGLAEGFDLAATAGTLRMANSLLYGGSNSIATNTGTTTTTPSTYATNTQPNVFGGVTDLGYNLSSDTSVALGAAGSGENVDLIVDTGLSAPGGTVVGLRGGSTGSTLALLTGSPGLGAIPGIPGISFPAYDQVFQARSSPTTIGAYEANALDLTAASIDTNFITQAPVGTDAAAGDTVEFAVETNDTSSVAVGFQWQFNGTNLIDNKRISGARSANLIIKPVTTNDAGAYTVLAGATTLISNGIVTNSATLTVYVPPAILVQPPKIIKPAPGKLVNISVKTIGDSTPDDPLTFQWYLESYDQTNALSDLDPGVTGSASSTLTLYPLESGNAGRYFVVAANQYGSVTSSTVTLSIPPPKLAIGKIPLNVTDETLTVEGTAESEFGVTNVLYEVNGETNSADSVDDFSTWSATLTLQPGSNTFSVYSVDILGQESPAKRLAIFYTMESTLTLLASGYGTISSNFTTDSLVVGRNYGVTALPGSGNLFARWTETWTDADFNMVTNTATNRALRFLMEPDLTLTATFVTNYFNGAKGTYSGLFSATNGVAFGSAGLLQNLVVGAGGAYSGKLYVGATNYAVAGNFNAYGAATNQITNRITRTSLTLVMKLDFAATPPQLTGSVGQTGGVPFYSTLLAERAATGLASAQYTLLIPPGAQYAPGYGYALITNHLGTATVTGALADGSGFSETIPISQGGSLPVYAALPKGGLLWGLLGVTNQAPAGELTWIKPAAAGGLFPVSFTNVVAVQGELWTNPSANALALQFAAGELTISNSGADLGFYVAVSNNNALAKLGSQPTNLLTGSINARTGLLSVTFGKGNGEPAGAGRGIVVQKSGSAVGFFTNAAGAGWIGLSTNLSTNAPVIVQQPASRNYVSNANVQFSVHAIGALPLSYQWQFDGTNLTDGGPFSGATSPNLTVSNEVIFDAGSYSVIVSNSVSNVVSSNATLTITAPALAITPKPGPATTNNPLVVRGTASDKYGTAANRTGLSAVLCQVNSNGWRLATTTNNWANWVSTNALRPGTNIFQAYSADLIGNHSATSMVTAFYVTYSTLNLLTNVDGAIKPGFANKPGAYLTNGLSYTNLAAGSNYTVTAVPEPGALFSNWTASFSTNLLTLTNNPLTFLMESNMTLTANFVSNIFAPSVGIYNGLFWSANTNGVLIETAGMLYHLVLTNNGTYSGKLLMGGTNYLLAGRFSLSGRATNSFGTNAAGGGLLMVEMTLETAPTNQIVGTVSSNSWTANLTAELGVANPNSAEYTLLFPSAVAGSTNIPPGDGYALVTNHLGMVTLTGALADGSAFNETVPESQFSDLPIYASIYSNTGVLIGWVNLDNLESGTPTNALTWIKKLSGGAARYHGGFTNTLSVQGAPWSDTTPAMTLARGDLLLTNAGASLDFTVAVLKDNTITKLGGATPNSLSGTIDPKTGFLKVFFGTGTGTAVTEGLGAVLQDQDMAGGFFLTATNAGALLLQR